MNWGNIHLDHVKPISSFDILNDSELKKAFTWKNTQPLLKGDSLREGRIFILLDYILQFVKVSQFLKLNEQEG